MGDTQTLPDYPRGLTFEHVWAALMETRKNQEEYAREQKESREAFDREMKESREAADRRMKETARQIKDINKRFGEYSNRLGEIAEYMVAPKLKEKFNELGMDFQKTHRNSKYSDRQNNIFMEIDVMLENDDMAMLVEIKTNLLSDHLDAHIERLKKMRKFADSHGDKRAFLGAVAGVVIPDDIRSQALSNGMFVIEPSGETFSITFPAGKPKEW